MAKPQYLGPVIVGQGGTYGANYADAIPIRVKFVNLLPTGAGGNLFIPVDASYMGAGTGPLSTTELYTQNRVVAPPPRGRHAVDLRRHAAPVDRARG